MPGIPYQIRTLRQQMEHVPPKGDPYYSAKCGLKGYGDAKSADRCDLKCRHLKAVTPLNYGCVLGMMVKLPPKVVP